MTDIQEVTMELSQPDVKEEQPQQQHQQHQQHFGRGRGRGRGNFRGSLLGDFRHGNAPAEGRGNNFNNRNPDGRNFGNDRGRGGSMERGRGRGGFRGRGGMGSGRGTDERLMERFSQISGPTHELPMPTEPVEPKKFTNRCRLFVGNITDGLTLDEFVEMFSKYGEIAEPYINTEKSFGFVKLDFRQNAEAARRALDGTVRNNRVLKVRFSAMGCSLKVKRLSPFVSNELLEMAFSVFGELERATVIVDDRGKSTGEAIIEFSKKPCALQCMQKCNDSSLFITQSLCPVEVEVLKEDDLEEGLPDRILPKKHPEYMRERSVGPRLAVPGSFEYEFGQRWKELYLLEKHRKEQVQTEMRLEAEKLQDQMEYSRREHETELLREQLRQRELEQERSKSDWEQRQLARDEERRRFDASTQRRQEQVHERMRQSEEDLKRRTQENRLFVQANELSNMLDQQEQMWGGGGGQEQQAAVGGQAALPDTFPTYGVAAAGVGESGAAAYWSQPPPNYSTGDAMNGNGAQMGGGGTEQPHEASPGGGGGYRGGGRGGYRGNRAGRDGDGNGDFAKRQRMY